MARSARTSKSGNAVGAARNPAPASIEQQLELLPGQSLELLKALHILTADGRINQDSRRKLKQVRHLVQFIEPLVRSLPDGGAHARLADHGAGKSYLGFILYDLLFRKSLSNQELPVGIPAAPKADLNLKNDGPQVFGIETRAELVERSQALAAQLGFGGMRFVNLSVAASTLATTLPDRFDIVTALHACDTATDDAIDFALQKQARFVVLVPCCQAETARHLNAGKALNLARKPLAELWRHPLHTRELGSQLTNVMRCLYLEAMGFQVTVTELVGWEHSLKNELIIAKRVQATGRTAPAQRLHAILDEFGLQAMLPLRFGRLPANSNI